MSGVRAASFSFFSFNQGRWSTSILLAGANQLAEKDRGVSCNVVGDRYFETMGLPVLTGRGFGPQDVNSAPKVAVVNETWVRRFSPEGYPVGRHFQLDGDDHHTDFEVVGVVKNSKYESVREDPLPMVYFPVAQRVQYLNDLEVRVAGDPAPLIPRIRQALAEVAPTLPINYVTTMAVMVDRSLARERLIAKLSGFFGLLALALACVGLYGTMSYAVARRTNEIGIRMALGAPRTAVLWLVLRESLLLVSLGAGCSMAIALWAQRFIASLLFGLKPADPVTVLAAVATLLAVSFAAAFLPARKAARVDPMVAVRYE
jgi:predicted permease